MDFSTETVSKRFSQLAKQRDPLVAEREALWAELNKIVVGDTRLPMKAAIEREAAIRVRVRELHAKLAPIDQEYANCAKMLGSKRLSVES